MSDNESRLKRQVQELRAEVRRLRRMIEGIVVAAGLFAAIIFPQLALAALGVAVMILFAFLVSPVRGMIFSTIFQKTDRRAE